MADLLDLAQVVLDVVLAPSSVMSSQRCSPKRDCAPLPFADVLFHAPRHHVARGELLLLGLVVGHEAMAVDVLAAGRRRRGSLR